MKKSKIKKEALVIMVVSIVGLLAIGFMVYMFKTGGGSYVGESGFRTAPRGQPVLDINMPQIGTTDISRGGEIAPSAGVRAIDTGFGPETSTSYQQCVQESIQQCAQRYGGITHFVVCGPSLPPCPERPGLTAVCSMGQCDWYP